MKQNSLEAKATLCFFSIYSHVTHMRCARRMRLWRHGWGPWEGFLLPWISPHACFMKVWWCGGLASSSQELTGRDLMPLYWNPWGSGFSKAASSPEGCGRVVCGGCAVQRKAWKVPLPHKAWPWLALWPRESLFALLGLQLPPLDIVEVGLCQRVLNHLR